MITVTRKKQAELSPPAPFEENPAVDHYHFHRHVHEFIEEPLQPETFTEAMHGPDFMLEGDSGGNPSASERDAAYARKTTSRKRG
jgi:hypothetical protein